MKDRAFKDPLFQISTGFVEEYSREINASLILQIISELVESCRNHDFTDIVVLHEHRGEPDGMVICHLPFGPTAYFGLYNTV